MGFATEKEFSTVSSREFWVTGDGRKLYPSDFEDNHLINTVRLLKNKAKNYRLEKLRKDVEKAFNLYHDDSYNDEEFFHYNRNLCKYYYDSSISDTEWLEQSSKIYSLLLDEMKYRDLKLYPKPKSKYGYKAVWA